MNNAIYAIPETKKAQETFYPTPPELAKRMISLVKWSYVESVLEPSAGKGDLARYACWELNARHSYHKNFAEPENYVPGEDVDCVEIDPNLQAILRGKVHELSNYEFSVYNIYQLMVEMNNRVIGGIEQTILDLFDEWTVKYHWDEMSKNIHYYNGWKTNDSFAVNKKVILPLNGYTRWSCAPDEFKAHNVRGKLGDIEKVFNYLDGGKAPDVSLSDALAYVERTGDTRKVPTKHFYITFYKKGTCHVEFRDPDLLAKFNIFAGRHKKWLPPSFGRKGYKELDKEEKAVVDSFMGKEAYEQVVSRPDYFLQDASQMLLLT